MPLPPALPIHDRSEAGFTLVELLVTMTVALLMLAAILGLWTQAAGHERRNAARHDSLDRAATALERMTREVRQAAVLTLVSDRVLELRTYAVTPGAATGELRDLRYDCGVPGTEAGTNACRRTDLGGGDPATVLDGLASPSVFHEAGNGVQIRLAVDVADARNPIVIHGGASPRNR